MCAHICTYVQDLHLGEGEKHEEDNVLVNHTRIAGEASSDAT